MMIFVHFLDGPKVGKVELFRGPNLPHPTWVVPLRIRCENPFVLREAPNAFVESIKRVAYEVFSRAKDKDFEHWYYRLTKQGNCDYMEWLDKEQTYFGHKERRL